MNAIARWFLDAKFRWSGIFATDARPMIVSTPMARTPERLKRS